MISNDEYISGFNEALDEVRHIIEDTLEEQDDHLPTTKRVLKEVLLDVASLRFKEPE